LSYQDKTSYKSALDVIRALKRSN